MNVQHLPLRLNDLSQRPDVVLNLLERYSRAVQQSFGQGQMRVLINTDVSSRRLDIPQVDPVIVTFPPQD